MDDVLPGGYRYARSGLGRFGEGRRMTYRSREVDRFMEGLDHPLKEEIERLRAAILGSNERITEHVKWKAPSFRYAGEDRVTFRFTPGGAPSWSSTGAPRPRATPRSSPVGTRRRPSYDFVHLTSGCKVLPRWLRLLGLSYALIQLAEQRFGEREAVPRGQLAHQLPAPLPS